MFMAILTLLTALSISAVAIYYSIAGLAAIFAAAAIPIMIMGTVLEVGKLVTASWLYQNWKAAGLAIKTYLSIAVVVLMLITSMGIFGFLSKAHVEQSSLGSTQQVKLDNINEKIIRSENKITRWSDEIARLNSGQNVRVDILIDKQNEELAVLYERIKEEKNTLRVQADKDIEIQNNRLAQARERKEADIAAAQERFKGSFSKKKLDTAIAEAKANELAVASAAQRIIVEIQNKLQENLTKVDEKYASQIEDINTTITGLRSEANVKTENIDVRIDQLEVFIEEEQDSLNQVNEDKIIIVMEQQKLEVEVGPLKYIAEFIYGQEADKNLLEEAVRWVIITIIFVFDPLAVCLLVAANMSFIRRFGRGFEKQYEYDPELIKAYTGKAPKEQPKENDNEQEISDLKKRHEEEIKEFGEKLSEAEKELQEQLDYQKSLEQDKPEKLVINIDETAKIETNDDTEKKKG
jgi:hypothetical protein|tara:strand:- start:267 stop:1661 length:1395 start_codon:yes stop_codon:yes gene_type:complete